MAQTITEATIALTAGARAIILGSAGSESYIAQLGNKQPFDLTTSNVLSVVNYSGSQVVAEGEAKRGMSFELKSSKVQRSTLQSTIRFSKQALAKANATNVDLIRMAAHKINESIGHDIDIATTHVTSPDNGLKATDFNDGISAGPDTLFQVRTPGQKASAYLRAALVQLRTSGKKNISIVATDAFYWELAYERNKVTGQLEFPQFTAVDSVENGAIFDGAKIRCYRHLGYKNYQETMPSGVDFVAGALSTVQWGLDPKEFEIFKTGDPDNSGRDLAGHNEIAVRLESAYEYVILDKNALITGKAKA